MLTILPEKQYADAADFCKLFLSDAVLPRYVLGRNEYAVSIANLIDVNGFIDDFTSETSFLGKPILKMSEISKGSAVVSAVIFVAPLTAIKKLKSHDLDCLDYFNFIKYSGLALKEIAFLSEAKKDIERNRDKYQWVYDRLEDESSKYILDRLVNFRFSGDLNYMQGFELAPDLQYFEDFLNLKPGEVFIDAGGFDGQTTINFIKRCPDYKSIHFFEPDPNNITVARSNLSEHRDIYFYTMGLGESKKTLRFSSGGGSASKVSETGDIEIRIEAIDNLIEEPVSMIKMDIEGAEGIALQGAGMHILSDQPKLAICCYHNYDDLWKIPQQVLAIRDDFSIYLRHYTDGLHETVMYFIPNERQRSNNG